MSEISTPFSLLMFVAKDCVTRYVDNFFDLVAVLVRYRSICRRTFLLSKVNSSWSLGRNRKRRWSRFLRVYNEPRKYDLARRESPSNSVVRAPDRCTGGHVLDSHHCLSS